jgi:predicted nucleic acid-binding protein
MGWFMARETAEFRLSAISVGELRRGVSLMDPGARRRGVQALYANIVHRFANQVVPVDARVAEKWGELSAKLKQQGAVIGTPDELIAATALAHGLVLVTRNHRHFEACGCELYLPWSA